MIPGMNPRKMQQMMKQMGMEQEEVDATRVIIETKDANIVLENPSVSLVNMMGQETFQITGSYDIMKHDATPEISNDDVQTVMEQTKASEEDARKAIEDAKGDLAEAIMKLTS